jgi:hypothetical protein
LRSWSLIEAHLNRLADPLQADAVKLTLDEVPFNDIGHMGIEVLYSQLMRFELPSLHAFQGRIILRLSLGHSQFTDTLCLLAIHNEYLTCLQELPTIVAGYQDIAIVYNGF